MSLIDFLFPGGGSPIAPKPLRFWHGLRALAVAIFLMLLISIVLGLLAKAFAVPMGWGMLCFQIFLMSALFAGCAVLGVNRLGYPDLKLIVGSPSRPMLIAIAVLGVFPAGLLADQAAFALHGLRPDIFSTDLVENVNKQFQAAPLYGAIIMSAFISIFPAIGEELMFRGIVLQSFRRDMPAAFAVVFSSVLFGAVHPDWLQGSAAGLIGLYLGLVTVLTGSIHAAVAAHFVNNLFAAIAARTGLLDLDSATVTGHPPAVVAGASVLVAFIGFVLWRFRQR